MSCETCYEVQIPECPSSIRVKGGLEVSTTYFITVTDKFGERYTQQVTSDIHGWFTIETDEFPAGTFNRHAGNFTLEARKVLANCAPELMQFCVDGVPTNYSCIIMSFFQSSLGSLPTDVGCICNEPIDPAPSDDQAQEFPFTNVLTVTCVHGLGRFADVTIYNSLGVEIEAEVYQDPLNLNQVVVTFNSLQSGTVIID